ncbi:cilia- and flagella-associated protein 53-like [Onthophagus taurus]|uniref:cilia- and flagella-associated protein 53-like n=1 Tax=Onthophagus taurus TaxID=166361 RepID=UPI000C20549A|nr:trichohyalin-like [Onthophagus taurus]
MFGGALEKPKLPEKRPKKRADFQDILMPGVEPGTFGHVARPPDSNYSTRIRQYHQRNDSLYNSGIEKEAKKVAKENYLVTWETHTGSSRFKRNLNLRLQEKMNAYDDEIERKRERMRKLMAEDERDFYYETIDNLQKGKTLKLNEIKEKIARLRSERETERLKLVEQKRLQQYADRCEELRPIMAEKRLKESKIIQLQQMRENEARRQADKELDGMWYQMMQKELFCRMQREEQEEIDLHLKQVQQREDLEKQIKGNIQAREEAKRLKEEDRIELERMIAELKEQELQKSNDARKKSKENAEELRKQIEFQRQLLAERAKAEEELEMAYTKLAQEQYEKERSGIKNTKSVANRELKMYSEYLKQLKVNDKIEEERLGQLLKEFSLAAQKKEDDARCKVIQAKQKLLEDTIKGIAEQRAYKLKKAQEELKEQEAANELMKLCIDTNNKLIEEYKRNQFCVKQKYKEDLEKQINYNKLLKERENAELERMLELGRKEEEDYKQKVKDIIEQSFNDAGFKHPFRAVLEQYDCRCPETPVVRPKY